MINPRDFRLLVIRPTLQGLGLWSAAAERLLLGTALAESGLRRLKQVRGPALGLFQMEPATHEDLWKSYLRFRPQWAARLGGLTAVFALNHPPHERLIWNLRYATAMARLVYWRRPEPLPDAADLDALGTYWKAHYNTRAGDGTPARWRHAIESHWQTPAFRDPPAPGT